MNTKSQELPKGVYLHGFDEKGKRTYRFSVTFEGKTYQRGGLSLKAAITRRDREFERVREGKRPTFLEPQSSRATVKLVAERYAEARPGETLKANHLSRILGTRLADKLTETDLLSYRKQRKEEQAGNHRKKVGSNTINKEIRCLRAAINWAKRSGLISESYFLSDAWKLKSKGVMEKEIVTSRDRFTDQAFLRITALLEPVYAAIAQLAFLTGMRRNEVALLSVDECRGFKIELRPTSRRGIKNGEARDVFLNSEARALLARCLDSYAANGFVFAGAGVTTGQPVTDAWERAARKAGHTRINFHDLRHEWASRFVENGGTLIELMKAGGWKSLVMVQRYAASDQQRILDTLERLSTVCPQVPIAHDGAGLPC